MDAHNHCDDFVHGHSNFHGKHTADGLLVPEGTPVEYTDGPGHHCHSLPEPEYSCYSKPQKETTTVYHTQDNHNHEATRHRPYRHQYRHVPSYHHHHHRAEHNESIHNLVECLIKEKTNNLDHNLYQMHQSIAEYNNRFMDIFNEVARNTANTSQAQDSIQSVNRELERLIASNNEVTLSNTVLKNKTDTLALGLSEVKVNYKSDIQESKSDYIERIRDLEDDLEDQLNELRRDYVLADTTLQTSLLAAIDNLETLNQINLDNLKVTIDSKVNDIIHDLGSELEDKINAKAIKSVNKEDNIVSITLYDDTKFTFETGEEEEESTTTDTNTSDTTTEEVVHTDTYLKNIRISDNEYYLELILTDGTIVYIAKSELVSWLGVPSTAVLENQIDNLESDYAVLNDRVTALNSTMTTLIAAMSTNNTPDESEDPTTVPSEYEFFGRFNYPTNSTNNNTLNSAEVNIKIINSSDPDKKVPEGAEVTWIVNGVFNDENIGSYLMNAGSGKFNMPASGLREIDYVREPLNTSGRTSGYLELTAYYIDSDNNKHDMIGLMSDSNPATRLDKIPFSDEAIAQGQGIEVPISITYNV